MGESMKGIITADWHLRATRPQCRIDEDWILTQKNALNQIKKYSEKYDCNVYCVGDLFHANSDVTFEVQNLVIDFANELCTHGHCLGIIAGNHDLPFHNSENIKRSAIGVILEARNVHYILDCVNDESQEDISAPNFDEEVENKKFIFRHVLTFPNYKAVPFGVVDALTAKDLLEENRKAKWIFTGDYHRNFHYEKKGRHVINPGCLLRQASDFEDYQPVVYFVDTEKEIVKELPINDSLENMDTKYITVRNEREERISAFVESLSDSQVMTLDFVENVEKSLNSVDDEELKETIKELIYE